MVIFSWIIDQDTVTFTLNSKKVGWWGMGFGKGVKTYNY
jgi:hypothetical protein